MSEASLDPIVSVRTALVNEQGLFLVVRRALDAGRDPGLWEFPGGQRDNPDEPLVDTAVREFQEETALLLGRERIQGPIFLQDRIIPDGKHVGRRIHEFGMTALDSVGVVDLDLSECVEHKWITRKSLVWANNVTPLSRMILNRLF